MHHVTKQCGNLHNRTHLNDGNSFIGRCLGKTTFESRATMARSIDSKARPTQTQEQINAMPVVDYAGENPKAKRMVYMAGMAASGALGDARFLAPRALPNGKVMNPFELALKVPKKPHLLPFACHSNTKVVDISCGYGFTLVAARASDTSHTLFGCGLNQESQIGYHTAGKLYKPLYKGDRTNPFKPLVMLTNVVPIALPLKVNQSNTREARVVRVAAGRAHSLALTEIGDVFALGCNSQGQCGKPPTKVPEKLDDKTKTEILRQNALPHLIRIPNETVKNIVAGHDHSLFLTERGEVWSCGWGADGQTGLGHLNSVSVPTRLEGDLKGENIIQVSCFADSALAINDKGDVFGWGNAEYSQFNLMGGAESLQQISRPTHLKLPSHIGRVVQVASGGSGCILLNEKGQVYVWGFGLLGMGPAVEHLKVPTLLKAPLFGCNEYSPDVRVTSIYAGQAQYAAVNSIGDLYVWGKNKHGLLGLGHEWDQYFPYRVSVPLKVTHVSLGMDHTAIVGSYMI